jgi:hypothetical protein
LLDLIGDGYCPRTRNRTSKIGKPWLLPNDAQLLPPSTEHCRAPDSVENPFLSCASKADSGEDGIVIVVMFLIELLYLTPMDDLLLHSARLSKRAERMRHVALKALSSPPTSSLVPNPPGYFPEFSGQPTALSSKGLVFESSTNRA